jgi:hypothetical protein
VKVGSELLQLAVSILGAISAVNTMVCDKQLSGSAAQPIYPRGIGVHHHPLSHGLGAGSDRIGSSFDFDKAQPTGGKLFLSLTNGTEVGNINAII